MFGAEPHVGVGGQMKDEFTPPHRLRQQGPVQQIAPNQLESRAGCGGVQERRVAGGEIIVDRHLPPIAQEPIDEIAANKAGAAGDEYDHNQPSRTGIARRRRSGTFRSSL